MRNRGQDSEATIARRLAAAREEMSHHAEFDYLIVNEHFDTAVDEIRRVFRQKEPVGRRLDFLLQEFNREANTLGSKSVDARTSAAAVELKVLIDQVREQVQNIE